MKNSYYNFASILWMLEQPCWSRNRRICFEAVCPMNLNFKHFVKRWYSLCWLCASLYHKNICAVFFSSCFHYAFHCNVLFMMNMCLPLFILKSYLLLNTEVKIIFLHQCFHDYRWSKSVIDLWLWDCEIRNI